MQSLKGTKREWVLNVLTAFIDASLDTYTETIKTYQVLFFLYFFFFCLFYPCTVLFLSIE